jgi:hypothetical protein
LLLKGQTLKPDGYRPPASPVDLAWAAGFMDGEGYFGITRDRSCKIGWRAWVACSNTKPASLLRLKDVFGCGRVSRVTRTRPVDKIIYRWEPTTIKDKIYVISALSKYLLIKRPSAIVALNFLNARVDEVERGTKHSQAEYDDLYSEAKRLNRRGVTR